VISFYLQTFFFITFKMICVILHTAVFSSVIGALDHSPPGAVSPMGGVCKEHPPSMLLRGTRRGTRSRHFQLLPFIRPTAKAEPMPSISTYPCMLPHPGLLQLADSGNPGVSLWHWSRSAEAGPEKAESCLDLHKLCCGLSSEAVNVPITPLVHPCIFLDLRVYHFMVFHI